MTTRLVRLVLTGAKGRAPAKILIVRWKSPAGALVQRFPEEGFPTFQFGRRRRIEIAGQHLPELLHQRTSG